MLKSELLWMVGSQALQPPYRGMPLLVKHVMQVTQRAALQRLPFPVMCCATTQDPPRALQ